MNRIDQQIADCLRTRIIGLDLNDAATLGRVLNAVAEEPTVSAAKSSFSVLQIAVEEGVPRLIKDAATMNGGNSLNENLDRLAQWFSAKRHLAASAGQNAVRVWAAALDAAPLAAEIQPAVALQAPRAKSPRTTSRSRRRRIADAVILVAVVVGLGLGIYYRREIAQRLELLLQFVVVLAALFGATHLLVSLLMWAGRKLDEGQRQIKRGLDWIPGWVYIVVVAGLGVSDWLGVLPYGLRDVEAWINAPAANGAAPVPSATTEGQPHESAGIHGTASFATEANAAHQTKTVGRPARP